MFASWTVAISLRAIFSGAGAFAQLNSNISNSQKAVQKLQQVRNQVHTVVGVASGIVGTAVLAYAKSGIDAAGDYQMALQQIEQAAGRTGVKMEDVRASILKANVATGQTLNQTTGEYLAILEHGLTLKQLLTKGPSGDDVGTSIAKYAHIQQLYSHVDPIMSATNATMAAHQQGVYDPVGIIQVTERLNKLGLASGAIQQQVITQGGYFVKLGRSLGMSVDKTYDIMEQLAISGLLRNKGGTGVADILIGLAKTPTGRGAAQKLAAERELNLVDSAGKSTVKNPDGTIQMGKVWDRLTWDVAHMNMSRLVTDFGLLAGTPGIRMALQLFNPAALAQAKLLHDKEMGIKPIDALVDASYKTWNGALNLLGSNLQTFTTILFLPFVTRFSGGLLRMADAVADAITWLNKFPDVAFWGSLGLLGAGIAAIVVPIAFAISAFRGLVTTMWTLQAAVRAQTSANVAATVASNVVSGVTPIGWTTRAGMAPVSAAVTAASVVAPSVISKFANVMKIVGSHLLELATFGAIAGQGNWTWLPRLGGWFAAVGSAGLRAFTLLNPIVLSLTLIAGAFGILWAATQKPIEFGKMIADIQNFFQYKMWPAISEAWVRMFSAIADFIRGTGALTVVGAFGSLIQNMVSMITDQAMTFGNVVRDLASFNLERAKSDLEAGNNRQAGRARQANDWLWETRHKNDRANEARRDAYDKQRGKGATEYYNRGPQQKQLIPHAVVSYNITINGATGVDHDALAKKLVKGINSLQERQAAKARNANGGMSTSPWSPQVA